MDINADMYDDEPTQPRKALAPQPTEQYRENDISQRFIPAQPVPINPYSEGAPTVPLQSASTPFPPPATVSRRKFMGVSVAGLAAVGGAGAAAAIGGVALAKLIQNGGLGDPFHGPMASSSRLGIYCAVRASAQTLMSWHCIATWASMALWIVSSTIRTYQMMTWKIVSKP